ncbi:hypothetical protein SPRG_20572 [Saprolegnia parasitica CBS 223.65]|uniref:Uncharacterized protein n=1 Tax=Saprolegnia parasitica (strain CBS 223.65) TaxID=695850 RepID=A0A067C7P2_SAPPC|nr:hypothetical protein SPRG_20572 [Saprolegnia parasitica CBS 223.65]KDO26769.1 hypothetical protein SPRG_20572 [Saprolegnia parasitica CBS 223.65]|eukprot:XP_012202523.1 hypothetical protein SPRG_20572 [Saprolegnia parasitica CBS 223.65]
MEIRRRVASAFVADESGEMTPRARRDSAPRSRSGSEAPTPLQEAEQLQSRNNEIAEMLERNEITPLLATSNERCDMCNGLWTDESSSSLFRFHPSGIVCDQSCLLFAARFISNHPMIQTRDDYLAFRKDMELNQSGVFKITAEKAVDLPSVRWLGRQDPYVRLALLPWNEPVQTKAALSGGKNPTWREDHANEMRLQHRCTSSNNPVPTLEVQLWSESYLGDDLIASCLLSTLPLLQHPNVHFSRWFTVTSTTIAPPTANGAPPVKARISFGMVFEPQTKPSLTHRSSSLSLDTKGAHKFRVHTIKSVGVRLLTCVVCERVIMSSVKGSPGYRCEDCHVDVHKTCMMSANTNVPCGTALHEKDARIPTMASSPTGQFASSSPAHKRRSTSTGYRMLEPSSTTTAPTFGKLYVHLKGIHLCSKDCQSDKHAVNVFEGDTYCRMSFDGLVRETNEVYKTADPVFDDKVCIVVTNRDAFFRLETIDLNTNAVIGEMKVLLFELLQADADRALASTPWLQPLKQLATSVLPPDPHVQLYATRMDLETYPLLQRIKEKTASWAEKTKLLLYVPKQKVLLQGREEKEFAIETLKLNIDRLNHVINSLQWLEQEYLALICWKDPVTSGLVLFGFCAICLRVDAEYAPAMVFILLLAYMVHTLLARLTGQYVQAWVAHDDPDVIERTRLYRPIAHLWVAVVEATFGPAFLAQKARKENMYTFLKVVYEPKDADQEDTTGLMASGAESYFVGRTHIVRTCARPIWRSVANIVSHISSTTPTNQKSVFKKEHVFRNVHASWPHAAGVDHHTLVYPLLQPAKTFDNGRQLLVPWASFPGDVTFEVYNYSEDQPQIETLVGRVRIPIATLASADDTTITLPMTSPENEPLDECSLTVRLQLRLPVTKPTDGACSSVVGTLGERKMSQFLLEALHEKDKASSTLGTVLFGAFYKAKDTTKTVQNAIGRLCATVVCTQNLFNWTHPWKTAAVFLLCVAGAILFSIVPARYLILASGLLEFGAGLRKDRPPSNTARNILWNFISSMPTDIDLMQAYSTERGIYATKRAIDEATQLEVCKKIKFHALWMGPILTRGENDRVWKTICLVYRYHRFVFWKSVEEAESGHPPFGQLIVDRIEDIKEIPDLMARKSDDPRFIFYVLGDTGEAYQDKRFFGFNTMEQRDALLGTIKAHG